MLDWLQEVDGHYVESMLLEEANRLRAKDESFRWSSDRQGREV